MSEDKPSINLGEDEWDWGNGAKPLTKELLNYLKEHGVIKFTISYTGGSDEGYYYGDINEHDDIMLDGKPHADLTKAAVQKAGDMIDRWADYPGGYYNGAGEGIDYGDDYTYDLKEGTVEHTEWYHAPQEVKHQPTKIQTED